MIRRLISLHKLCVFFLLLSVFPSILMDCEWCVYVGFCIFHIQITDIRIFLEASSVVSISISLSHRYFHHRKWERFTVFFSLSHTRICSSLTVTRFSWVNLARAFCFQSNGNVSQSAFNRSYQRFFCISIRLVFFTSSSR